MPWIPCTYVHQRWPCRTRTPSCQGSQASHRVTLVLETIKSSKEITRLFKEGKRLNTKDLTLIVLRNEKQHGQHGRAAFVAGKKLGNAVWRNRAKRRMRAVCKDVNGPFEGYDVIFLAKKSVTITPYGTLLERVNHALEKSELFTFKQNMSE